MSKLSAFTITMKRLIVYPLAGLGFLWLAVTVTPLDKWWATQLSGPWDDPKGEVLIVLGGSSLPDGLIGESSYWRSIYAVRTYRQGGFQRVILAGKDTAAPMKRFLECEGVPSQVIQLEARSTSTRENALFTKEMLGAIPGRKVLLTSDYHMFRAHRTFRKAGLEVEPRPFPDVRKQSNFWTARWSAFIKLATETMKIVYYYARGWI